MCIVYDTKMKYLYIDTYMKEEAVLMFNKTV